jgi:hypothetical protein
VLQSGLVPALEHAMSFRPSALAAAALLLLAAGPLAAQQVYQWKDANGVTQYSQTPPKGVEYESREIHVRDGTPAQPAEKPAEAPGCTIARENLALLDSDQAVAVDSDGDGTPDRNLDEDERAAQRELAQAAIKVNCAAPEAAGKPQPQVF